ncbi:hypothetical protein evm_010021 [Chilo suppressalis]|nr:hypothetical protein evm_010021 [Chilo suppressalis]
MLELCRAASARQVRVRATHERSPPLAPDGVHREGVLLDVGCPWAAHVVALSSSSRAFNHRYTWLLVHNSSSDAPEADSLLGKAAILPDADLTWADDDALVDLYRVKESQPLISTTLTANTSATQREMEYLWAALPTAVARRRDLQNVYLKAATIISQPHHFKGWTDLTVRHIDTFPKLTYPLMMLCAEDLHFRYNLKQVDLYGEERNGSFDGLAGMLQRDEIEIGITSMFMRADRMRVLHFSAETVELRGAFIFRQPSQSSVSNVFLLPLSRGVWASAMAVFVAAGALLAALSRRPTHHSTLQPLTVAECFTFTIGTVCQQGSHLSPNVVSVRVVMLFTLLSSLFVFTSYSAKIVAILQTPSDAIQTIDDLTRSPMALGVQETTYKRVYFAESNDPATQRLYRHKLLPLGERAYLSVVDGVNRLRTGLFAFQVEESSGYDIISKTFTESEKCGLQRIQAFKLPMVAIPIRRLSGYRDLLAARW